MRLKYLIIAFVACIPLGVNPLQCVTTLIRNKCWLLCATNNVSANVTNCDPGVIELSSCKVENLDFTDVKENNTVKVIYAEKNYIRRIYNHTFQGLIHVEHLDLSDNMLFTIDPGAFSSCKRLQLLDLTKNFLLSFNMNVIMPLNNVLKVLLFGNNRYINTDNIDWERHLSKLNKNLESQIINPSTVLMNQLSNCKLERVDISNNDLLFLLEDTFKGQNKLNNIEMDRNKLTDLVDGLFKDVTNLVTLNISHNHISKLSEKIFLYTSKINYIDLSYNELEFIEEFAFMKLEKLQGLDLNGNKLQNINMNWFLFNFKLNFLDISSNNIDNSVKGLFRRANGIKDLIINNNNLITVEHSDFKNLIFLRKISITNGKLSFLQKNLFYDCRNLETIDLSGNHLTELNENIVNEFNRVESMSLSNNTIERIANTFLEKMRSLREIDLSYNRIKNINEIFKSNFKINTLKLAHNMIDNISSDAFVNKEYLHKIDLSYNYLSILPKNIFYTNSFLTSLSLANNKLKSLPDLSNKLYLEALDLSNNQLIKLTNDVYTQKPNLNTLFISNNFLTEIPENILEEANHLSRLNFNQNFIQKFTPRASNLGNPLKVIMASCNNFTIINNNTFTSAVDSNTKVYLHGNPLICGCLNLNVNIHKERFLDGTAPNCIIPQNKTCNDKSTAESIEQWNKSMSLLPNLCNSDMWGNYDDL